MRKISTVLFIFLFCFAIGVGECQEKELPEEEKAILELEKEKEVMILFWVEQFNKLLEEAQTLSNYLENPILYYEKLTTLCEAISKISEKIATLSKELLDPEKDCEWFRKHAEEKEVYELFRIEEEKWRKEDLKVVKKYIGYPTGNSELDSLYESYMAGHISARLFLKLYEAWKTIATSVEIEQRERIERLDEIRRIEREIRRIEFDMDMERIMFFNDMMFLDQFMIHTWDPSYKEQLWLYLLLKRR